MSNRKVVKFRRPVYTKIWKILLFLILIYISILILTYTSKDHVTIYEVSNAQVADDTTWQGVIIRNERIVKTKYAGYINYYNPANNRIGVGDIVYTIDGTGDISDVLTDINYSAVPSSNQIKNMRNIISSFQEHFDFSHYSGVYDYRYDIENAVFEQAQEDLYVDLEKALRENGKSNTFHKVSAKRTGIISYTIDGLESLNEKNVTRETLEQKNTLEKTQLREKETVEANAPAYGLITDENWSLVVPIDQIYYEKLLEESSIGITVKKDNLSFQTAVRLELRQDGYYAILSANRFMERYSNDRFLDIEINLNSASGLKIPNSSVLEKEFFLVPSNYITSGGDGDNGFVKLQYKKDGTKDFVFIPVTNRILIDDYYYVSKDLLKAGDLLVEPNTQENATVESVAKLNGVFLVNRGYCKFVRVEKIYENSEYTVVNDETANGLSIYDHIVVDPLLLHENDLIQ